MVEKMIKREKIKGVGVTEAGVLSRLPLLYAFVTGDHTDTGRKN